MNGNNLTEIVESVVGEVLKTSQNCLTLSCARKLINLVLDKAEKMGVNAVVAVSGSGANPIAVECMDGSFIASYDIALNKSYTSVAMKMSTKELKPLAQPGGSLYGIQFTNGGKIVIFGGGVPLYLNGKIVGGLGVSGGTEAQDTELADYGQQIFKDCI